jgi:6-bladed beta-propeller
MKTTISALLAAAVFAAIPAAAQNGGAPQIQYQASEPLQLPTNVYLGEVGGVATNSKGDIFVYTRTGTPFVTLGGSRTFTHGGSKLYEFGPDGKFMREIGQDMYGMLFAAQVRIDPQDNIWLVDQMSNMVIELDPTGSHVVMLLGRKPEAVPIPARETAGGEVEGGGAAHGPAGAGRPQDVFDRPTDVAWDAQGDIFVADGLGNARIAKFDKNGRFIKSWGHKGTGPGEFANVRSIAVDANGDVYGADGGNRRIQVFDNNGNFKREIDNVGNAQALCLSKGSNPILFSSDSNPPNDIDHAGDIMELKLDGSVMGRFGHAGKMIGEFGTVNAIDCRNPKSLLVGEIGNLRVQRVNLRAG